MFTTRRIDRPAILCALVCALLLPATSLAAAQSSEDRQAAALAQERYYSSYGEPQPIDAATAAARAQERYYSSYGEPEPLTLPQSPAPSDDTPWLPIALSIVAAAAIVAASTAQLRRLLIRRRHTARVTT
jgi:hypothetical protein